MKTRLLILIIILFFANKINASHVLGGEITWECLKSGPNQGKFIFIVKRYFVCIPGNVDGLKSLI